MPFIRTRADFIKLTKELGVRADFHEPDEQGVDATLIPSRNFDNAMGDGSEHHIVLSKDGKSVGKINLANLLAWAMGHDERQKVEAYGVRNVKSQTLVRLGETYDLSHLPHDGILASSSDLTDDDELIDAIDDLGFNENFEVVNLTIYIERVGPLETPEEQ